MKRYLSLAVIILTVAFALSCSDGEKSSEEVPDVSGSYYVKSSTCAFASVGSYLDVSQDPSDKRKLSISVNSIAMDATNSAQSKLSPRKGITFSNASVSTGGGISLDVNIADMTTHNCTGAVTTKDEVKTSELTCSGGGQTCNITGEIKTATPADKGGEGQPCIVANGCDAPSDGTGCWSGKYCNPGFICNDDDICEKSTVNYPKGNDGGPCYDDGTCNAGLQCLGNICGHADPWFCSETEVCPEGAQCENGICVNKPAKILKKFGEACAENPDCAENLVCSTGKCAWDPSFVIPLDQNLAKIIRQELGLGETDAVTVAQCAKLPYSILPANNNCAAPSSQKIKSLAGIEYCPGLKKILLICNEISDISPLAALAELNYVKLVSNKITDCSPFLGTTTASTLDLRYNTGLDIGCLLSNPNLGPGDKVSVKGTKWESYKAQIEALEAAGVDFDVVP